MNWQGTTSFFNRVVEVAPLKAAEPHSLVCVIAHGASLYLYWNREAQDHETSERKWYDISVANEMVYTINEYVQVMKD